MCNCGHDELEQADRLSKRIRAGVVAVMCLVAIEIATRGATALLLACVALQAVFVCLCVWLFLRRRSLLCADAR